MIKPADIFAFSFQRANTFFYSLKGSFDFSPLSGLVQLPTTVTYGFLETNDKCTFLIFTSLFSIGVGLGAFFHSWASIFSFPLIYSILEWLLSLPLLYIFALHLMFVFRYILHPHYLKSNHLFRYILHVFRYILHPHLFKINATFVCIDQQLPNNCCLYI